MFIAIFDEYFDITRKVEWRCSSRYYLEVHHRGCNEQRIELLAKGERQSLCANTNGPCPVRKTWRGVIRSATKKKSDAAKTGFIPGRQSDAQNGISRPRTVRGTAGPTAGPREYGRLCAYAGTMMQSAPGLGGLTPSRTSAPSSFLYITTSPPPAPPRCLLHLTSTQPTPAFHASDA
ncbi:hypothetical protein C8Q78DRAFT_601411 [Trametes maxima]|nr:hypothetical protein C8Q78DRAFT_601411 [Trametes maxima]